MSCKHQFEHECHECRDEHAAIAAAAELAIMVGDTVTLGGGSRGIVNEVTGHYAYVAWEGGRTRKDPLPWLRRCETGSDK